MSISEDQLYEDGLKMGENVIMEFQFVQHEKAKKEKKENIFHMVYNHLVKPKQVNLCKEAWT